MSYVVKIIRQDREGEWPVPEFTASVDDAVNLVKLQREIRAAIARASKSPAKRKSGT